MNSLLRISVLAESPVPVHGTGILLQHQGRLHTHISVWLYESHGAHELHHEQNVSCCSHQGSTKPLLHVNHSVKGNFVIFKLGQPPTPSSLCKRVTLPHKNY